MHLIRTPITKALHNQLDEWQDCISASEDPYGTEQIVENSKSFHATSNHAASDDGHVLPPELWIGTTAYDDYRY